MCIGHRVHFKGCGHDNFMPTKTCGTIGCEDFEFEGIQIAPGTCLVCEKSSTESTAGSDSVVAVGAELSGTGATAPKHHSESIAIQYTNASRGLGMTIGKMTTFMDKLKIQALEEQVKQLQISFNQSSRMQIHHEKLTKEKIDFLEKAAIVSFTAILERGFRKAEEVVYDVNQAKQSVFIGRIEDLQEQLGNCCRENKKAKKEDNLFGDKDALVKDAVTEWDDSVKSRLSEIMLDTIMLIQDQARGLLASIS